MTPIPNENLSSAPLRFAIFGTGFWAPFQLAAWRELPHVECVALFNRTREKAEKLAQRFRIPTVYDDAEALLQTEKLDFVDIITDVETHLWKPIRALFTQCLSNTRSV